MIIFRKILQINEEKKKTETRERERRIESINSRSSGCNSGGGNNKIIKQNRLRKSTHNIYIYRKRMQVRRRRKETRVGRKKKKTRRVCERARTGRTFFADGATLSQSWRRPFRPSAAPIESGPHKTRKKNQTKENKSNEQKSISKNRFHLFSRLVIGRPQRVDDAMLWRRKEESGAVPDQIFIGHRFFLPAHCVCAPTARLS